MLLCYGRVSSCLSIPEMVPLARGAVKGEAGTNLWGGFECVASSTVDVSYRVVFTRNNRIA